MQVETTIAGFRAARERLTGPLGLVPTMGALHEGHLSLVRTAKDQCNHVAATIFVNPTQFGPGEDFARYPRTLEVDRILLESQGVDLLFVPSPEEMYPPGDATRISVGAVADRLDGASRPGHFTGVATVVAKLFNIVAPQKAFFGQKDAAQVAVLRQMVRDLNFNLELIVCPIVRESDGLAMSSRNRYLSQDERQQALVLSRALSAASQAFTTSHTSSQQVIAAARAVLDQEPFVRLDYLSLVDPDTLEDLSIGRSGALLAVAAFVGQTRLIDNTVL